MLFPYPCTCNGLPVSARNECPARFLAHRLSPSICAPARRWHAVFPFWPLVPLVQPGKPCRTPLLSAPPCATSAPPSFPTHPHLFPTFGHPLPLVAVPAVPCRSCQHGNGMDGAFLPLETCCLFFRRHLAAAVYKNVRRRGTHPPTMASPTEGFTSFW